MATGYNGCKFQVNKSKAKKQNLNIKLKKKMNSPLITKPDFC